ncbi:MAG TPA: hypothetical protein VM012_02775, partial [Flavitalea sp.]|nr:hypothetical protein [Flavitalea sp.]
LFDWRITLGIFALRMFTQAIVYFKSMRKLNEKDLYAWWFLLDWWMFLYYCIFAFAIWRKPKKNWN